MTRFDDRLVPKVYDIVQKYGRVATFYVRTKTEDPNKGTVTFSDPVPYKRRVTPRSDYDLTLVDGDTIKRGDTKVLIAAQGLRFTPSEGMQVDIGDDTWTVISVTPLDPGEKSAAYKLQLRR